MKFFGISLGLALSLSLVACGGGSGGTTTAPPSATATLGTAGIFDIQYGQFSGVYTFLDNGEFYGVHFVNGIGLAGHPHGTLTAANSTSAMEHISWANFIDDVNLVGAQESDGKFGRTFTSSLLNVHISGSMGSFSASASAQKTYGDGSNKTLYNDPLPMSVVAGTYKGLVRTVGINTPQQNVAGLTIDSLGNFTVTAVSCTFTGKLVQHGKTGVFDTQVTTSGADCHLSSTLKGVLVPMAVSANLPSLSFQLDSADNLQTAVFYVSKS
jgi:hypothetical protein